jgi:transcriptional repressor NrdR
MKCEQRFTTIEEFEAPDVVIVKRDGKRESYDREKVRRGIVRSLEKRPYTDAALKQLLHQVEASIQRRRQSELTSADIGEIVMEHLHAFDHIGYIRFASVYRQFEDAAMFAKALSSLHKKPKKKSSSRSSR